MIPTSYKARLPKSLAYPVRAGQLSDALAGVPQFDGLSVSFHEHPFGFASHFADAVRSGRPYAIVRASYVRTPMGINESSRMAEMGLYGPKWCLSVYSVPTQLVGEARVQVVERGLPIIRAWLLNSRSQVWCQSSHQCEIQFSTSNASVVIARPTAV